MDVHCEVCGIVTEISGSVLVPECLVCGASLRLKGGEPNEPPAMAQREGKGSDEPPAAEPPALVQPRPGPPASMHRRPSRPVVKRDDDDPTMMDLRALALKSFLSQVGVAKEATYAAEEAPAAAGEKLEIEVLSMDDVLGVHDSLVPVAAPSRPPQRLYVQVLLTAGVASAAALIVFVVLVVLSAGEQERLRMVTPGVGLHSTALARDVARVAGGVSPGQTTVTPPAPPSGPARTGPGKAAAEGRASASRRRGAAGGGTATASPAGSALTGAGARATPAPTPAAEAPPPPPPPQSQSLAEAMAAAVAGTPAPAATAPPKTGSEPSPR